MRSLVALSSAARLAAVDLRLRGEGESAPLVQTIDYYRSYFEGRARDWEAVAFGKCRFIAGEAEPGLAFMEMLRGALPAMLASSGWRDRMTEARRKLEALSTGPWDVKHAPGGRYDIDFLLAAARLRGAIGDEPSPDVSRELDSLASALPLDAGEKATLAQAFDVYYLIEHAAALHGFAYPPLPEREEFFGRYLDRLLGARLPGEDPFADRLSALRAEVRRIAAACLERIA
jgi:glutamate-ammonia-ligase adenylyltransferase